MHRPALFRSSDRLRCDVVNAYLAEDSIADRIDRGLIDGTLTEAMARYRAAIDQGLAEDHAKMGISVISSYRGGLNFEAVGLSRAMVAEYFPGMPAGFPALACHGIQRKVAEVQATAGAAGRTFCRSAASTKRANRVRLMPGKRQRCTCCRRPVTRAVFEMWKQYSAKMRRPPIHLRDLMDIKPLGKPVPIEEVESITASASGSSRRACRWGSEPEAHKTLNVAMNRIGAKSDQRRGWRGPGAFHAGTQRRQPSAKIKQVASRPVWRDSGISEPVRRAGDQGRPGRQAR